MVCTVNPIADGESPGASNTEATRPRRRFGRLTRVSSLIVVAVLLSGCGLPPAISIISYALDGISYLASGKSVSDHALSVVTERDCALFRAVMGTPICRDNVEDATGATALAAVTGAVEFQGFARGTEVFALKQDDGVVEVFVHDPKQAEARDNIHLLLKIDDYDRESFDGFNLNGAYYAISDILV